MIAFFKNLLSNDPDSLSSKRFLMLVFALVLVFSYLLAVFTKFIPPIDLWNSMVYLVVFMMGGNIAEKFTSFFKKPEEKSDVVDK